MAKFLIVDDSRVMLKMIRRVVEGMAIGHEIVIASSGEEAVAIAADLEGELVGALIDHNMTGMNGIECGQQLRAIYPDANLALCTANSQNAVAAQAEAVGFGVVHKPISDRKLQPLFEQWQLGVRAAARGAMSLSSEQSDVLKEAFNIGVGKSAASLSSMVGDREVLLSVPAIEVASVRSLTRVVAPDGDDICAVVQRLRGPIEGKAHLIYSAAESFELARELIGSDTAIDQMIEMESGALLEIGNIVLNACVSTFGHMFGVEIRTDVPELVTDSAEAVLTDFGARTADAQLVFLRMDFDLRDRGLRGHLSFTMGEREFSGLIEHVDRFLAGVTGD